MDDRNTFKHLRQLARSEARRNVSAEHVDYFNYCTGLTMTNGKFDSLFDRPGPKTRESTADTAGNGPRALGAGHYRRSHAAPARSVHERNRRENLCLAGGVALNCVGNGRILREGPFKNSGYSRRRRCRRRLGAAYAAWHQLEQHPRQVNAAKTRCAELILARCSQRRDGRFSEEIGAPYERLDDGALLCRVAG